MTARRHFLTTVLWALPLFAGSANVRAEPFDFVASKPMRFGNFGPALSYVVLGDSTAAAQGAAYEDGIAVMTARALAKTRTVILRNFSVSGAKTADVLIEQLPAVEDARPDLVLISVGANDVTHLTRIGAVEYSLVRIIHRLRAANAHVVIVLTGSPDMGAPPRVPRLLRPIAGWRTQQLNRMFESVAAANGVTFAPIAWATGRFFRQDHSLFG
jgi:lysophospholipase L1-like esterase